jgi:putative DNA primase/helicase
MFYGKGNNGKTTLLETVRYIMGDYAAVVEMNSLMQRSSNGEQMLAVAGLPGIRFATASEANEGQPLDASRIKQLSGIQTLKGKRLYTNPFEFFPELKLYIDSNHKPVIQETDNAIWNLIKLVPFNVEIPPSEIDTELGAKLRGEAFAEGRKAVDSAVVGRRAPEEGPLAGIGAEQDAGPTASQRDSEVDQSSRHGGPCRTGQARPTRGEACPDLW